MRALKHHVRGVRSTRVAVSGIKVHALIEAHVHTAFDNRLISFDVFRIRQANVLDVAAFAKVEALKLVILLFKGRDIFCHIEVERVRKVFRAVVLVVFKLIVQSHFFAVVGVLTSLRRAQAFSRRTVNGVQIMVFSLKLVELLL